MHDDDDDDATALGQKLTHLGGWRIARVRLRSGAWERMHEGIAEKHHADMGQHHSGLVDERRGDDIAAATPRDIERDDAETRSEDRWEEAREAALEDRCLDIWRCGRLFDTV